MSPNGLAADMSPAFVRMILIILDLLSLTLLAKANVILTVPCIPY